MTYAIVNGSIWKYNATILRYVFYYNNTIPLLTETATYFSSPLLCVVSRNITLVNSTNTTNITNSSNSSNISIASTRVLIRLYSETSAGLRVFFNYTEIYEGVVSVQLS